VAAKGEVSRDGLPPARLFLYFWCQYDGVGDGRRSLVGLRKVPARWGAVCAGVAKHDALSHREPVFIVRDVIRHAGEQRLRGTNS